METKLYFYGIIRSKDEYIRVCREETVKETAKRYSGLNDLWRVPYLDGKWVSKSDVGKVIHKQFGVRHYNEYILVLTERNDEQAVSMLLKEISSDYDKIEKALRIQNEAVKCCGTPLTNK